MTRGGKSWRWVRGVLLVSMALPLVFGLALGARAAVEPFPRALLEPNRSSVRIFDRHGRLIRELRSRDGKLCATVELEQLSPWVVPALLAAEDARFFRHPGIDPLAMLRAGAQAAYSGRLVSGASTLTQQLARNVVPRPRTLLGKFREMAISLRIEASLTKRQILESYLNRVEFGPNLRGIEAASQTYFDKPARDLDLSEAATLAAIPRGPSLYDPRRGTALVTRRRNRILERMLDAGSVNLDQKRIAQAEPVRLERALQSGGAEHFLFALAGGALSPELRGEAVERIDTTIDADLQREVAAQARRAANYVEGYGASAAAVIVVENATGDVLSYLGSPDFAADRALGKNDGTRALRQPGSTLKPFVYAAAMERLGMTAASLLPDIELTLPVPGGAYAPRNYDGRFHGPVRLRDALANSLNVPAVYTISHTGPESVLALLHRVGFVSLDESASHYGAALALGDGEVRLTELAQAYATLARGGEFLPLRVMDSARLAGNARISRDRVPPTRALDSRLTAVLTDILADDRARSAEFGRAGALSLPFPVAAKTGTSKGFRDNWTVGFTHEVTVAVWVGNFDGTPMVGSTGVTGAGPLFHEVMLAAMRGRTPAPLIDHTGLVQLSVCDLSGALPNSDCPHQRPEWFLPERVPAATCAMHQRVRIDPVNRLRAGPACPDATLQVFEEYPAEYATFALQAARPIMPRKFSGRCPGP